MADAYYLRYRGRTVGPYTLIQSQQMARKGQLARTSEVSTDGHSWSQAASFPEIFEPPANSRSLATSNSTATHEVAVVTTTSSANQVAPRAPAIASSEWYYASGGQQQGPTSASNIIGWIKAGTLTSADRVWRDGLDNWVSISDVPEFNAAIGPTAPHRAAGGGGAGGGAFCCYLHPVRCANRRRERPTRATRRSEFITLFAGRNRQAPFRPAEIKERGSFTCSFPWRPGRPPFLSWEHRSWRDLPTFLHDVYSLNCCFYRMHRVPLHDGRGL